MKCMQMGISHIDVLSYFYTLPNNNSVHNDPNLVHQSKDTDTLCNTCLLARKQSKQDLLDTYPHKSSLNHHHKNLMDSLSHKHMSSYLHTMLDFKDILLHIAKSNYQHKILQDIALRTSLLCYQQKNQLDIH